MTDDDSQKHLLRRLIKRQLIAKGKPSDEATINQVFEAVVADNPGPWFDLVTDPKLIEQLNRKAGIQ